MSKTINLSLEFINTHVLRVVYGLLLTAFFLSACSTNSLRREEQIRLGRGIYDAIALSPDGSNLAVGTSLGLSLYRADTFQEVWFSSYESPVWKLVFSPDGMRLASITIEKVVLWDALSGRQLRTLAWNAQPVDLRFSPDGTMLALADGKYDITVWNAEMSKVVETMNLEVQGFRSGPPDIWSVAWSSDSTTLAAVMVWPDSGMVMWNVETGEQLHTSQGHTCANNLELGPDGTKFVSSWGSEVVIWDAETGERIRTLENIPGASDLIWSPDGTLFASVGTGSTAFLWDVETGELQRELVAPVQDKETDKTVRRANSRPVRGLVFSPDGKTLFSGSETEVVAWDVSTGEQLRTLVGIGDVTRVAFSPDGTRLVSGSRDGVITLWNAKTNESLGRLDGHINDVSSLAFSPDGTVLVTGANDDRLIFWDVRTWEPLYTEDHIDVKSVAFSPDGMTLALAVADDKVILLDVETGTALRTIENAGWRVAWSPDGAMLASGTYDGIVMLWDAETGKGLRTLQHTGHLWGIAWSPDGMMLSTEGSSTVVVWDVETSKQLYTLEVGHSAVWSPDWTKMAYEASEHSDFDYPVVLWDVENNRQLRRLKGHTDEVICITFSPDGKMVATGSADGSVILWDVP